MLDPTKSPKTNPYQGGTASPKTEKPEGNPYQGGVTTPNSGSPIKMPVNNNKANNIPTANMPNPYQSGKWFHKQSPMGFWSPLPFPGKGKGTACFVLSIISLAFLLYSFAVYTNSAVFLIITLSLIGLCLGIMGLLQSIKAKCKNNRAIIGIILNIIVLLGVIFVDR